MLDAVYLLLVSFFLLEYRIRVRLFRAVEHPGFFRFLSEMMRLDPREIHLR